MSIITGYYNSLNGDRKYNADTMSKYFVGLIARGVLQNYKEKFIVKAYENMKVKVPTGKAFFSDGKWIENTADITLTIDPSDIVLDRIDRIVLRNDKNEDVRAGTVVLKKGSPASNPLPPSLEDNDYIEELSIATIRVKRLVEVISQADITNTIPDSDVCGYVTGLIDQVDTSDLYIQYENAYENFRIESQNAFEAWFATVKDKFSTATLLRQYTHDTTTSQPNQKVIAIGISQYEPEIDILNVYVNNLWLIEGKDYTKTSKEITLTLPLDINQKVYFSVLKSVDGEKAITVIEQVENLQNKVADLEARITTLENK